MNTEAEDNVSDDLWPLASLDDRAGPARRISPEEARSMVLAAMSAVPERAESGAGTHRRGRAMFAVAAVAALFVTTGAAAAVYLAVLAPSPSPRPEPAVHVERAPAVVEAPEEEVDLEAEAIIDEAEAAVEESELAPIEAPRAPSVRPTRAAEDLLERASALRGERRWRDAERMYLRVKREFPKTHAAYVATIAAASLRLEHLGDAKGARTLYRIARKRAPNGVLDADILFGLAGAERALGDVEGERRALLQLLDRHPQSVFVPAAKRRLAELDPP